MKRSLTTGAVSCAVKAVDKCTDRTGAYTQRACDPPTTLSIPICIDVADTNNDQRIGSGDSGDCTVAPTCGNGVREGWEECDAPGAGCPSPWTCIGCFCLEGTAAPTPTLTRTPSPAPRAARDAA